MNLNPWRELRRTSLLGVSSAPGEAAGRVARGGVLMFADNASWSLVSEARYGS